MHITETVLQSLTRNQVFSLMGLGGERSRVLAHAEDTEPFLCTRTGRQGDGGEDILTDVALGTWALRTTPSSAALRGILVSGPPANLMKILNTSIPKCAHILLINSWFSQKLSWKELLLKGMILSSSVDEFIHIWEYTLLLDFLLKTWLLASWLITTP